MAIDVYKEWLGIPEGNRPPDHYELLRLVKFEDDTDKIRAHYKKLNTHVRRYATGQYSAESQELLNELAKAMLCITDAERKREYDESLGREFEPEKDVLGRQTFDSILISQGSLTREQAREMVDFAEKRGLSLRDAAVQMKLIDPETSARTLAASLSMPFVDLEDVLPDDSVLDQFPRQLVRHHKVLPLFVDNDVLLVACIDEIGHELEDEFRLRFEGPIRGAIATPLQLNQAIAKYYAAGVRDEAAIEAVDSKGKKKTGKQPKPRKQQSVAKDPAQQQQLVILIACWIIIGAVLLDQFVVRPYLLTTWSFPYVTTLFAIPAAAYYYWVNAIK